MSNRIVRIQRTTDTVSESLLRKLHESMKSRNASHIIFIGTGEFSKAAVEFANTRPIELIGKPELVGLLKSAEA